MNEVPKKEKDISTKHSESQHAGNSAQKRPNSRSEFFDKLPKPGAGLREASPRKAQSKPGTQPLLAFGRCFGAPAVSCHEQ
jgi:hypothetical protein